MSPRSRIPLMALLFTVFLDLLGFGMIIPILALYAERFGVSDVAITGLAAIYSVMQLLFAPIWGRMSDRYGRRPILLLSIAGSCLSQLGYALAPSFAWLVVARALAGVCGANISAAQAYIADSTEGKDRAAGMAMLGSALGLGFAFGPVFGGLLGLDDPHLPFLAASMLSLGNFIVAFFTLREPLAAAQRTAARALTWKSLARTVATPRLRVLIGLLFVVTFGFAQLEGTFPLFLERRFGFGRREVSWVFAGMGAVIIVAQGVLVRRLVNRVGERALVIAGTALMATGMALAALAHGMATLVASAGLVALGSGLNSPALSSLISRATDGDQQGGVLGVSQSFSALARGLGPLCGGVLLAYGPGAPYVAAAGFMLGGCLIALGRVVQPSSRTVVTPVIGPTSPSLPTDPAGPPPQKPEPTIQRA